MRYDSQQTPPAGPQPEPSSNLVDVYVSGWRRMFDYRGTSTRTEYWVFVPVTWILWAVIGFAAGASIFETGVAAGLAGVILWGYALVAFLVLVPITVRRVRDATGSGWFTFLFLVFPPLLVGIALCPRYDRARLDMLSGGYWDVWRKSADYLGVAKRGEFWPFTLINLVLMAAVFVAAFLFVTTYGAFQQPANWPDEAYWQIFRAIFLVSAVVIPIGAIFAVPGTAVLVRRVRDATSSGWVALVAYAPWVGGLALLVITILPSRQQPGATPESVPQRTPVPEQREEADPWARGQGGNSER